MVFLLEAEVEGEVWKAWEGEVEVEVDARGRRWEVEDEAGGGIC